MFKLLFLNASTTDHIKTISCFRLRNWLYILYHKSLQNTNPCPAKLYKCPLQKNRQIDHQIGARSYFPPAWAGLRRFWGCKKARPVSDGPFCTRSGISPVRCPPTAVKENSRRRRRPCTRYLLFNKKKKISVWIAIILVKRFCANTSKRQVVIAYIQCRMLLSTCFEGALKRGQTMNNILVFI